MPIHQAAVIKCEIPYPWLLGKRAPNAQQIHPRPVSSSLPVHVSARLPRDLKETLDSLAPGTHGPRDFPGFSRGFPLSRLNKAIPGARVSGTGAHHPSRMLSVREASKKTLQSRERKRWGFVFAPVNAN